jgi:hypothetical protein
MNSVDENTIERYKAQVRDWLCGMFVAHAIAVAGGHQELFVYAAAERLMMQRFGEMRGWLGYQRVGEGAGSETVVPITHMTNLLPTLPTCFRCGLQAFELGMRCTEPGCGGTFVQPAK